MPDQETVSPPPSALTYPRQLPTGPALQAPNSRMHGGAQNGVIQAGHVEPVLTALTIQPVEEVHPPQLADPSMSEEQLIDLAFNNNPALQEAQARVNALRGKWTQVGLPPNTVIGYSGQQLASGGKAEQHGLFIGQEFVRGGKLALSREVVAQEIRKAEQLWAAQRQRIITDVRLSYYEVMVAQLRNDTANELVGIANEAVSTAKALLKAGENSKLDVLRAGIELQSAELTVKKARVAHNAAWSRLTAVTGTPNMPIQKLQGDVERAIEEIDPQAVLHRLVNESPEMAALLSELERSRRAVDRAKAEPISNVDVQAVVQSDAGTDSSNANLQVTLPIPWLNRNQGGIQQAHAEVVAAQRALERQELSFQQQLATVYERYASASNQVKDYAKDGGILANSSRALEIIRTAYKIDEASYLDLINAQRTFSQTNLAYIEALGEQWAAVIEIEGLLLKGSLK